MLLNSILSIHTSTSRRPGLLLDLYMSTEKDVSRTLSQIERETFLKWAFLEANSFLKRYADVLEEIRVYLQTRTSSPGECSLLIEERLDGSL